MANPDPTGRIVRPVRRLCLELIDNLEHRVTVGRRGRGRVLHLRLASDNGPQGIPLEPGPSGIVLRIRGDFERECARLAKNGVEAEHRPEKSDRGWFATIGDPDVIEFNLPPVTSADRDAAAVSLLRRKTEGARSPVPQA